MTVVSDSEAKYPATPVEYIPVKKGVSARVEQRQTQGWIWRQGMWLVPNTLPKHQLDKIT